MDQLSNTLQRLNRHRLTSQLNRPRENLHLRRDRISRTLQRLHHRRNIDQLSNTLQRLNRSLTRFSGHLS